MTRIVELLEQMRDRRASDLFLTCEKAPAVRSARDIEELDMPPITAEHFDRFLAEALPPGVPDRLQTERDLDLGLSLESGERFRLNLYFQKGKMAMAARRVPSGALTFDELHIPAAVRTLAEAQRGLVLITGATGSGKSTSMAAMLHHIATHFCKHIVTIEDPIEYVHQDNLSLVSQREVGTDTRSFSAALKHVVRQNPDVIFIGEMRDLDTIQTAVSAAMTGHLVITTMHTVDVSQTLERILNYFPAHQREQIALDFALALGGIVSQRLLRREDGTGMVPVFEILVATPLVRRLISERQLDDISEVIKAGASEGMQTFTRALVKRCQGGLISEETAAAAATNREEFLLALQGMETGIDTLRSKEEEGEGPRGGTSMRSLLKTAVRHDASDLHLTVGSPPLLRITGELRELEMAALKPAETQQLLFSTLTPQQRSRFEDQREIDFALSVTDRFTKEETGEKTYRFRVNGFYEKGSVAVALRVIPQRIPSPEELNLPVVVQNMARRKQGLILVTGPTGHGKSTTLACLIDEINRERGCHVITVEDPIEFVHHNVYAIVQQREVHADTRSFSTALKYVLRQDPDVILIGEMRDQETIAAALTAAETGHLVLATLHTNDVIQTVDRIIDIFPAHQQNQVRTQLAACILGVVAQRLLPKTSGDDRIAAFEILLGNPAVRALIRDNRTHQIPSTMETAARSGMITMEKAMQNLYEQNLITRQTLKAYGRAPETG